MSELKVQFRLLMASFLVLGGCAEVNSPPPPDGLVVARLQDCKPGQSIPARQSFGPGETPTAVFRYCNGLTATVRVYNMSSGAICYNNTEFVPQEQTVACWPMKALPSDTYKAELWVGGTFRQSYTFTVVHAAARKR